MKVRVHLYSQSQPIRIGKVRNAYTKDGLYCILTRDGSVRKFPLLHIFQIEEE